LPTGATIDVSGGDLGGAGGFVEVSGRLLAFAGYVDLGGSTLGALLIDPLDLIIADTGAMMPCWLTRSSTSSSPTR
jgi:hypothetical protein